MKTRRRYQGAQSYDLYEPISRRRALCLLAGGLIGACGETDQHRSRALRGVGTTGPLVLDAGGTVSEDAGAIDANIGSDSNVVWVFLHTGQSLSNGSRTDPTPRAPITGAVAGHYMLDGQQHPSGYLLPVPWSLTTLANPARVTIASSGQYPSNCWDEVPMVAMGERLSSIAPSVTSLHEVFGIGGADSAALSPADPNTNKSFLGIATAVREIARLIRALGKEPRLGAIVHIHGESDNGGDYVQQALLYQSQIEPLVNAAFGTVGPAIMFLSQASAAYPPVVGSANTTWQDMVTLAQTYPDRFALAGPKYHLSYDAGDYHLDVQGSRDLGYSLADAWVEWRKLRRLATNAPTSVVRGSTTLDITFDLQADASLTFDSSLWAGNHSVVWSEWANGKGFEVLDNGSSVVPIDSATITGPRSVRLTLAAGWPAGILYLTYAHYSDTPYEKRRGQLKAGPFWAPHFSLQVP